MSKTTRATQMLTKAGVAFTTVSYEYDPNAERIGLQAAFGGKSAHMMKPADAERATGYHVGGISPFGQKKLVPTAIEVQSMEHPYVYMNGGQRGLQVRLSPKDALAALKAKAAPLVAD